MGLPFGLGKKNSVATAPCRTPTAYRYQRNECGKLVEKDSATNKPLTAAPAQADQVPEERQSESAHIPPQVDGISSGDNAATAGSSGDSGSGQNVPVAAGPVPVENLTKDISIDENYLLRLFSAIEGNLVKAEAMEGKLNELAEMIKGLNADIVDQLSEKSSQLDAANSELGRLKTEESDRCKVVDRLSRENSKLKDKCDEYEGIIAMAQLKLTETKNSLASSGASVKNFGMSVDANGNVKIDITNVLKKQVVVKIVKKDKQGNLLNGAQIIVSKKGASWIRVPNSDFEAGTVFDPETGNVVIGTAALSVEIGALYRIQETRAPQDFVVLEQFIYFMVTNEGTLVITDEDGNPLLSTNCEPPEDVEVHCDPLRIYINYYIY